MSDPSLDDVARRLEELPREAWDRPVPPPPPWPAEATAPTRRRRGLVLGPLAAAAASLVLLAAGVGAGGALSGDDDGDEAPGGPNARVELAPVDGRGQGATGVVSLEPRAGGRAQVDVRGPATKPRRRFRRALALGRSRRAGLARIGARFRLGAGHARKRAAAGGPRALQLPGRLTRAGRRPPTRATRPSRCCAGRRPNAPPLREPPCGRRRRLLTTATKGGRAVLWALSHC